MKGSGTYPKDWPAIAQHIKDEADWTCVRCGHAHDPKAGYCLTVHHLSGEKGNVAWWNCAPLCQRCHLSIQGRVVLERAWIFEHTPWFRPYVAGWYAKTYLGLDLTRSEVESRLEELLALEAQAVLGRGPVPLAAPTPAPVGRGVEVSSVEATKEGTHG